MTIDSVKQQLVDYTVDKLLNTHYSSLNDRIKDINFLNTLQNPYSNYIDDRIADLMNHHKYFFVCRLYEDLI